MCRSCFEEVEENVPFCVEVAFEEEEENELVSICPICQERLTLRDLMSAKRRKPARYTRLAKSG